MAWVSFLAVAVACFAAWQATRSAKTAKQAYNLAIEQDQRNRPSLELYLVYAYIRRIEQSDERIFVFQLVVTNKSASRNSIKDLQLVIEHQRKKGPLSNVSIPHDPELNSKLNEKKDPFQIPFPIEAYSATGGIAIFSVPHDLLSGSRVESYLIKIIDNKDYESEVEAILLQEKKDEQVAEKNN